MFCQNCGKELPNNSNYCPCCGSNLNVQQGKLQNNSIKKYTFKWALYTCLFQKYASFSGRACRSEYWWYILAVVIVYFFAGFFGQLIKELTGTDAYLASIITVTIILLIPNLSVTVRRLHDKNMSGWILTPFFILSFLPLVPFLHSFDSFFSFINWGFNIFLTILFITKGTSGPNNYGDDPLQ